MVTDTGGVVKKKTWKWALADEWECVKKRAKGKIGVAKSARQPEQNSTKKLTSKKRGVKVLRFCISASLKMKCWDSEQPVCSEKWS